ncbi:helix-turn-helix domain-containing protein [Desulfovibrio sp. OttesenSCG-928-G11]|nr:helix-turn-helix domain-containing protein [Desulfovibrio sp. OttesenSCG-928-G11]
MSQQALIQIITTPAELEKVLSGLLSRLPAAQFPAEVLELELLRRKEYLTTEEVEKLYPLKANTLRKRRVNGEGPAYTKDGANVVYSQAAIRKYLESRRQKTHDQP